MIGLLSHAFPLSLNPSLCAGGDALASSGLDSLAAVELSSSLSSTLGLQLPSTLAFDYPSVSAMAQHIHSLLLPQQQAAGAATAEAGANHGSRAVVPAGLPLASPAQAAGSLLVSLQLAARLPTGYGGGADAVRLVPFDKWDLEALRVSWAVRAGSSAVHCHHSCRIRFCMHLS